MEKAIILHNPGAGDEDHTKSDLIERIEEKAYKVGYFSIKKTKGWKKKLKKAAFAVVAGGDGTVRRIAKELTKRTILDRQIPLAILPMGTANNLSKTLAIHSDRDYNSYLLNWKKKNIQPFDLGIIKVKRKTQFFLESAGFGLFPLLMKTMDKLDCCQLKTAQDELVFALETLHQIVLSAPTQKYEITRNGEVCYSGKSLAIEILNTPYIGPNLHLGPQAKVDDGLLDIVCIEGTQRAEFADYIQRLLQGKTTSFFWKTFQAEALNLKTQDRHLHIDDELIETAQKNYVFEIRKSVLGFLR